MIDKKDHEKQYTDSALNDKIKEFLSSYKQAGNYVYLNKIDDLASKYILFEPLDLFRSENVTDMELYEILLNDPKKFYKAISRAVDEIFRQRHISGKNLEVFIGDVGRKISVIEALGNEFIENIVTIEVIISSKTEIYNLPDTRTYRCTYGHILTSKISLTKCTNKTCKSKDLEEITTKDSFSRHRTLYAKSQEGANQDEEIRVDVKNLLCDSIDIGDRVKITGIIETEDLGRNKNYQNIIRATSIQQLEHIDFTITEEERNEFAKLPEQDEFYSTMIHSIAPSIYGSYNVKESILLQQIGAPPKIKKDGSQIRGEIHIGMVGDPGTAKTKLGEWVVSNSTRSKLVMGKGATSTGLTLGIDDGPDGRKILRSGAMVNCRDGGTVVLDEFPRTSKEVIDGLYTIIENGIASISKTGFQTTIKANASLIITGNAQDGHWNQNLSPADNLGMDAVFLTRFDYIWIFNDDFDEKNDEAVSNAILGDIEYDEKILSSIKLQKYIRHCRQFNPTLTKEVSEYLKKAWLQLRKHPQAKANGITARHLETVERTTKSIARLYQKESCTVEDADKAIELMRKMLQQQNINLASADTYVQRNLHKAIEILKKEPVNGLDVETLFNKIQNFGTQKDQEQAKADLGTNSQLHDNKKYRTVVEEMKRSPILMIVSKKPLIFAYDHNKEDIRSY